MALHPSGPLPWQLRLAALAAAFVLSLSVLVIWVSGVKFMRLLSHVAQQIADSSAPPPPPSDRLEPMESSTPGVVPVGILPPPQKAAPAKSAPAKAP